MDAKEFEEIHHRPPQDDDLDRANCKNVGTMGHRFCGICPEHKQARFECGCMADRVNPHV